jgi:putative ABC transport system permease protein
MFETYRDLKYSLRMLRKNPGFAAVVVITLALGIGANTAIFSFVNAVVLNPLPFPDSSRLVVMSETNKEGEQMSVSLLNFQDWRARAKSFAEIGGVRLVSFNLTGVDVPPQRLSGQAVTPNFFHILGVQPQLGRVFMEEDDKYGIPPSVLISDSLWRTTFGSDPNILGKSLNLGLTQFTVIGVLPPGFEFMRKADVWAPLGGWLKPNSNWFDRGNHMGILALGRLKSEATLAAAETEIRQIAAQLEREYPATNTGNGAFTRSLQTAVVHEVSSMLLVLMGAVAFVLLIACVNVANLSLARAAVRTQEIGIRLALGAGRGRLMRQLFTENLLLALLGGLAGVLTARWLLNGLLALAPADLPRLDSVKMNGTVLLFTAGLTLVTSLLFGLLPTLQATRGDRFMAFNQSGRSSTASPGRRRLFDGLMVAEIGLALVLLTGAGLMTRTIYKLAQVDPGFRPDHLLTMRFDLVGPKYDDNEERQQAFLRDAGEKLKALPGVESAAFTLSLPIQGSEWGSVFIVGDQPVPERSQIPSAAFNPVSTGYLETMGIKLRRGRLFTDADGPNVPTVAVINETMARRFWPNEDPIGKRLKQGWPEWKTPWREVVGVVADVKLNGVVEETPLHVYLPLAQSGSSDVSLVLRTKTDPASMTAAAQAALREVDKDLPLYQVRTMDEVFKRAILPQRAAMVLLTAFALLSILLAAVGIYGVISWGVTQRTREMGLRMALGAQQRDVLWLILRRNMVLVFGGVVLGLAGALALTRVLSGLLTQTGTGRSPLLFGVEAVDPATFITVPLLLSLVALLACCLPARRATKVDPMVVLRYE